MFNSGAKIYIDNISVFSQAPSNTNNIIIQTLSYNNPVSNNLVINSETVGELNLISLNGQDIRSIAITKGRNDLDVSSLSSGMYIMNMRGENGQWFTGKLVKID